MRRALAIAVLLALVAGSATPAVAAQGAVPPYPQRLELAEALAARYPGPTRATDPLGQYGLWAGIVIQTTWQRDSHRDRIPLWYQLNASLTVEPSTYAKELEAATGPVDPATFCASSPYVLAHPTTATAGPAVTRSDVCEAWVAYFLGYHQALADETLRHLLWVAHTRALVYVLREDGAALFRHGITTTMERNFWASWIEVVFLLGASNFPTEGATSVRASNLLMPPCSPIGAKHCKLTSADLGSKLAFVAPLAQRSVSLDDLFAAYEAAQSGPAALLPFAADPSVLSAVGAYVAAGNGS